MTVLAKHPNVAVKISALGCIGESWSSAYLSAAKTEATCQGYDERVSYQHGNFVDLAGTIPPADIATLDRVICCYHDMPALVGRSAAKATRLYGLVYPRDPWWVRAGIKAANAMLWLKHMSFCIFADLHNRSDAVYYRISLKRIFIPIRVPTYNFAGTAQRGKVRYKIVCHNAD